MKIVLDTNVLVSGLLKPSSKPAAILRLMLSRQIEIVVDARVLAEYREVLLRPRFHFTPEQVDPLLEFLENEGILTVGLPLAKALPDQADEKFLEVALSARAEVLITGNKRHYPLSSTAGVRILSPSEFLDAFHSSK